jgi:hypothetical protein
MLIEFKPEVEERVKACATAVSRLASARSSRESPIAMSVPRDVWLIVCRLLWAQRRNRGWNATLPPSDV